MISMEMMGKIRRMYFRDKLSLHEIAKRTGLARNTIRKWVRAPEAKPPVYQRRAIFNKLSPFHATLEQALKADSLRPKQQRRSAKALLAQIKAEGYDGGYSQLTAFIRAWRGGQGKASQAFVPLTFALGEAFQFDWSEEGLLVGGIYRRMQVAHLKLCASRAFWLVAYPSQGHEMLFDAHTRSFGSLGGVPRRGIYDNMKTAVDRVRLGKLRDVNLRFSTMVSHYLFDAEFCNPASGWEKGQIEKNVQDSRHRIWQRIPAFGSLAALNDWLADQCVRLWQQTRHPELDMTLWEAWSLERPHLMPVGQPFDGFVEHTKRVSPTCLVTFERNRYSVPASFANRPISLRVYANRLVFVAEGQVIAEHVRHIDRSHLPGRTIYDWHHYLAVLQRKPGALRNGAPFAELPEGFRRLQSTLLKRPGGDREMVEILALVLLHDEQAVLTAVELALEAGAPSKQTILNILSRLLEGEPVAPITSPQALALHVEPQANVGRYDSLRDREVHHAA